MARLQMPLHFGRFYILVGFLLAFWLVLEINLFRFQVVDYDRLSNYAKMQYEKEVLLKAQRGTIFDRAGNKLATNIIFHDIAADPLLVKNKKLIAKSLANSFPKSENYYLKKLNHNSRFTYLERRTTTSAVKSLLTLNDPGLIKLENFGRFYPYGPFAAQLLGFTDPDDHGLSGMELQFESHLSGKDGKMILQRAATREIVINTDYPRVDPIAGNNIHLTLDKDIQTVVEKALKSGVDNIRGKSGMAIVMDPNSGAVLAMANYPQFDPNNHKKYNSEYKKNRVITDSFEPGSTMKLFSASALLQERIHKTNDIEFCENGKYKLYKKYFRDTKKYGWLSFRKIIEKSSNIGMIKLTDDLPATTLFRYLKNYGFGSKTNIGLAGESDGSLAQPRTWSGLSKASISIGYEIGVTALQMVAGFSALVNGGYLYKPFIVSHIENPLQNTRSELNKIEKIRQVISPEVSDILKDFMKGVVEQGTGIKAKVPNVEVGGKTGTAQKYDRKKSQYQSGKYIASFIGFAPFDKPKYVCAIFIDEPQKQYYGGDVAAPIFADIVSQIIHFNHMIPENEEFSSPGEMQYVKKVNSIPAMQGFSVKPAIDYLEEKDFNVKVEGRGNFINQVVKVDDEIVVSSTEDKINLETMPDLRGLTLRKALNQVDFSKLSVKIEGRGKVYKQSLLPGTLIKSKKNVVLSLK